MYYSEEHNIYFVRKKVKNITLRVRNDGTAYCTIPLRTSLEYASKFVDEHKHWLNKQRKKLQKLSEALLQPQEHEIVFRGEIYQHIKNETLGTLSLFDHEHKTIRTSKNMNDDNEREEWYIEQALRIIPQRVRFFAEQFGFSYGRITIRNQKTKWGSCSARKNLNFNYKLVKMPDYVLDYIVIHELVHTEFLHHGISFWQKVEQCYPQYKKAERYLRKEGRII